MVVQGDRVGVGRGDQRVPLAPESAQRRVQEARGRAARSARQAARRGHRLVDDDRGRTDRFEQLRERDQLQGAEAGRGAPGVEPRGERLEPAEATHRVVGHVAGRGARCRGQRRGARGQRVGQAVTGEQVTERLRGGEHLPRQRRPVARGRALRCGRLRGRSVHAPSVMRRPSPGAPRATPLVRCPSCDALHRAPAIATTGIRSRRSTRASVDGCVENRPRRPPPDRGFTIIICAVSGWRSAA